MQPTWSKRPIRVAASPSGADGHRPHPLAGGQGIERGQIFFVGMGQHAQPREVSDLEQVGGGVDQLAEGHVSLDDHAAQGRDDIHAGPLLHHVLAGGHLLTDQPGGLGPHGVDLALGNPPALQGPDAARDGDAVGLDPPLGLAERALGNGPFGRRVAEPLQGFFIHPQLRETVDQLALFLAQVAAPNHCQHLPLVYVLTEGDRL